MRVILTASLILSLCSCARGPCRDVIVHHTGIISYDTYDQCNRQCNKPDPKTCYCSRDCRCKAECGHAKKYPLSPIPDNVLELEMSGADLEKLKGNQSGVKK